MNAFIQIKNFWKSESQSLLEGEVFSALNGKELTREHYVSLMKELYFLLAENTRIYTVACTKFSARDMHKVRELLKDVLSTMDLEKKVVVDLCHLGVKKSELSRPLTATHALYASTYYHINYQEPYMIIGHLFILGLLAKLAEDQFYNEFKAIGLTDDSLGTLYFFCKNQYRPFKLIRTLLEGVELSEHEIATACHTVKTHCVMFSKMIDEAFERSNLKVNVTIKEMMP